MSVMNRVRVGWSGFTGAPGVSTFYFGATISDMTALKAFFTAMRGFVPNAVVFTIPTLGDQIDESTGQIAGSWTGTNGGTVNGLGGTGTYAAAAGVCIDWLSSAIIDGRRRQGRTFFIPAVTAVFQSDGTLDNTTRGTIETAANTLIAAYAGELKVFSRPFPGKAATATKPAKPPRVGAAVQVIAARVPDLAAVLRSRR